MKFKEGDVVVCPDKRKIGDGEPKVGTIWNIIDKEAFVLDNQYVLHKVFLHEIYHEQEEDAEAEVEDLEG
jgi:hypothetical protein